MGFEHHIREMTVCEARATFTSLSCLILEMFELILYLLNFVVCLIMVQSRTVLAGVYTISVPTASRAQRAVR